MWKMVTQDKNSKNMYISAVHAKDIRTTSPFLPFYTELYRFMVQRNQGITFFRIEFKCVRS